MHLVGGGLFGGLDDDARRALWALMRRRRFARGQVIFHEGDPGDTLHLIVKGHVSIKTSTPRGDQAILRVLGPDDVFGEFALISPAPRAATVTALDATETMMLDRESFTALRKERPCVDDFLITASVAEVRRLSAALVEALYLPVETRVLRRVHELAEMYRNGEATTCVPLGQDEIAQLAGVTRQTVNKVLAKAQQDGALHIERGRIEIVDHEEIRRRCR
ncbi:MAG TPA: Crp/Fnr family transcriptional regulator [Ilumatobacteraceae bacterium]|nr:Crp/Fnr family transcriptional regulator [Ilumatobacteraceae bacterium]